MVHSWRVLDGWGRLGYVIVCSKLGELVATVISAECKGSELAAANHGVWYVVAAFVLVAALGDAGVWCSTEDGWERSYFKTVFFTGLIFWAAAEVVIAVVVSAVFLLGNLVPPGPTFTMVDLGGKF
eukprot:CAMPEP_0204393436 /NCGR_PEP_ID=MMETSP0469-20131031/62315_1 /ASSEMBLY_ACC=CAM_ASM_000384 /TAXON_ID=2969 /ORGANISM="Oxyrrhis marina" /LENGTH=125 /DNA_ID=CAMNT_0051387501 /DNA_START=626 /DNA_END=1003 /DNA_ORIENTATION=-